MNVIKPPSQTRKFEILLMFTEVTTTTIFLAHSYDLRARKRCINKINGIDAVLSLYGVQQLT